MPEYSIHKIISSRVKLNLRFLFMRAIGLTIKAAPCKVFLIRALGVLFGVATLCLRVRQWNSIAGFARQTGSPLPGGLYILKYFVQKKTDRIWGLGFYEAAPALKKYFTVENLEALEQAVKEGRGVILLGAHYGPSLTLLLLNELGIKARPLLGNRFSDNMGYASNRRFLTGKKVAFLSDTRRALVADRSVKEIVRHIMDGGVLRQLIDFPSQRNRGLAADFFGHRVRFSYFPFKLALRHNAPIFFHYLDKAQNGGYRLRFVPSGDFSTLEEGVKKYAAFFQTQITANPFMWRSLPNFLNWFPESPERK